jgi:CBS domain-containing protein
MAKTVRDIMTKDPIVCETTTTVMEAARRMRDADIGDVLVINDNDPYGIVTDRDIVVRALAEGKGPEETTLGDIATMELDTVSPDDDAKEVVRRMVRDDVRRVPVVEDNVFVGILSMGDLAIEMDPDSVLADISAAPANN